MAGKNGLIGGIRSTFWRRVALVTVATPMFLLALLPVYARALPSTLAEAFRAFGEVFADTFRQPNTLIAETTKQVWSKSWKPVE